MPDYSTDRRSLLKIIGAVGTTCAYPFESEDLFGQESAGRHAVSQSQRYFNQADFQTISRIADLILPATDTPGAIAAQVPRFIDMVVSRNEHQQRLAADGLRWLDERAQREGASTFVKLNEAQQLAVLEPLCQAFDSNPLDEGRIVQFFGMIKSLTADGYYTSEIGLMEELQYKGSTMMDHYPSCQKPD